jgi:hypothetical protein
VDSGTCVDFAINGRPPPDRDAASQTVCPNIYLSSRKAGGSRDSLTR